MQTNKHSIPATRPRVIVVGNLTIDDVVLPDGTTQMASVGGNSLYTALGVRLWQPHVGLVTRRGEDFPRDLTTVLHSLGVATDGVVDIAGPTVRNWVVYEANGERHWIYRTPRERSREVAVQADDLPVEWLEKELKRAPQASLRARTQKNELHSVEASGAKRAISSSVDMMREEIAMIPKLLAGQLETLAGSLRTLACELNAGGIEHLYLVGCGDSAFAGAATALAFQKHAGIDAEGTHALDLARYRARYLPKHSTVVCISFSGMVGRTIEAAIQARRFGHRVLVFTGNPGSPLAQEATDIITLSVPTSGYSPGTSTYLAILAALLDLAVAWGEARGGDMVRARTLLRNVPDLAQQTLAEVNEPVQRLAEQIAKHVWVTFLGAGPNVATAHFGAAKLFEGPQKLGVATNIEEWAHEEYFVSGAGTPVFLIAPSGASFDRAGEILAELNFIGANAVFISDTRPPVAPGTFIPLASGLPEEFSPLLTALPLSLFAFYLTRASGQERFEFPSPQAAQEHYETIHRITQGEPA